MAVYDVPFVPSSDNSVELMMKLAGAKKGDAAVDLGAGDGKLVVALAKAGANATGVEIDYDRYRLAKAVIASSGLRGRAKMVHGSFWEHNLEPYDLIVLYGVPSIMEKLGGKILNEAKETCRIVSNYFEFPGWRPSKVVDNVYLYKLSRILHRAYA